MADDDDDDGKRPPSDRLPQAPSVELAAELAEVRDEARALIEVLTKWQQTNQSLPPDFPREPLIDVAKSLMQLRDAETEGIEVVLGYARLRLTAVRRRHIAPSERPDRPEPAAQAPGRGGVLDNKLALLIAAVSTALDQLKRGDVTDDPDERDPGIETGGDGRATALNKATAPLQATLDEVAAELANEKIEGSKLADAAARTTESASAMLRSARAETRMPEVVKSWLQRLNSGLKSSAGTLRQTLPYLRRFVDLTEKGHNYVRDFSDRASKTLWKFIYDETRKAIDAFNRFLKEIEGGTALGPPPRGFSMDKVHEMILAGLAPPEDWTPWIDELDFKGANLSDLKPLSGLTALQVLALSDTKVIDVSALSGLTALQLLDLRGTGVSDVSALSGLSALWSLDLGSTPVSDVTALSGLRALRSLNLVNTQVSDVTALSGLRALRSLNLVGTQVSDMSALSGLNAMRSLYLAFTQVSDLSALSGLTALQRLDLIHTQVSDVSALSSMTALQTLHLTGTKVSDVSALSGLTALEALHLVGTNVSDLTSLAGLTALQTLNLMSTKVTDVYALAGLTALSELDLGGTGVSDVSPLSGLTSLELLDISDTRVQSLAPLSRLEKLKAVYVSRAMRDILAKTHPRSAEIVKVQ